MDILSNLSLILSVSTEGASDPADKEEVDDLASLSMNLNGLGSVVFLRSVLIFILSKGFSESSVWWG